MPAAEIAQTANRAAIQRPAEVSLPGISAPTYTGNVLVAGVGTAAGIVYSSETSYYAGGGMSLKF